MCNDAVLNTNRQLCTYMIPQSSGEGMESHNCTLYHIAGYFRRVFIFRYFKEGLFSVKINSNVQLLFENIFSQLNKMLVCTHMITLSLQYECINLQLYRYFKRLLDPKGPLSKTLLSASIKAANEAVNAGRFETTEEMIIQISIFGHVA